MQIRRFYAPSLEADAATVLLSENESQHALRVLRLKPGDRLRLLNGRGVVAEAELLSDSNGSRHPRQALCRVLEYTFQSHPFPELTLCVAPPHGKAFDLVLKAAVELGFAVIQPILCQYGVARPEVISVNWLETLIAALKQSQNPWLPELRKPQEFQTTLSASRKDEVRGIFGASPAGEATPHQAIPAITLPSIRQLWVGPEGGFAPGEEEALLEAGMLPVTIGNCTLRVETAVPALAGYLWGLQEGIKP